MSHLASNVLMIAGAVLMLIAAIGVVRMPDLLIRMHATTKAGALGASLIFFSVAMDFADFVVSTKVAAAIAFILLTAPVAAHVLARAAYFVGVPLWKNTVVDELRGRYDPNSHALSGSEASPPDAASGDPPPRGERS